MRALRRGPVGAAYPVLGLIAVWLLLLLFAPGGHSTAGAISNFGLVLAAVAAAAANLLRSYRSSGSERRAWLLIGLAALSWGFGQSMWTTYEWLLHREVPFPSYADLGYLGTVPLLVFGLLKLPGGADRVAERLRLVLDGLVVGIALLIISWELLLRALVSAGAETWWKETISLSYPVGDVVCASIAGVIVARARHGARFPLSTLIVITLGVVSFSVGDSGFAYLTMQGTYYSGHVIDTGWFAGWTLLGLAALQTSKTEDSDDSDDLRRRAWASMCAPYVPVVFAVIVGAASRIRRGHLDSVTAFGLLGLLVLVMLRHALTQRENDELTDSLEARVMERTLALSRWERWWRALVQNSTDVVTVVDQQGKVRYQTPSISRVFGYEREEFLDRQITDFFAPDEMPRLMNCLNTVTRAAGEPMLFAGRVTHANGTTRETESTVMSLLGDPDVQGLVINTRDVSERQRLEAELNHRAFHDDLSGLANRALFRDRLQHALARRSRSSASLAVLFVDLDRFKEVNDTLGHAYGDELLLAIGQRLLGVVRPGDTVARFGGDEFAVLLDGLPTPEEAEYVASRIVEVVSEAVHVRDADVQVHASIGISMPDDRDDEFALLDPSDAAELLLRNADLAMYRAKTQGGSGVERYRPELHAELVNRVELEKELRAALKNGELTLLYQPTVLLEDGSFAGVEALVRWNSPTRGLVMPGEFIPVAEKTGLIIDIGAWVLHTACMQGAEWLRHGAVPDLTIAVNVSGLQLLSPGMVDTVRSALAMSRLPAQHLLLEMTESVLLERTDEMVALLHELKALGVRLAIDDFGTGYSSLSYLARFPVDVLKVDRSFVAQLSGESTERELTRTILQLGESLEMVTVAEGVETLDQLEALRAIGCDLAQGYLFSKPTTATEVGQRLGAAETSNAEAAPPSEELAERP